MVEKIELQWHGVEDEIGLRHPHSNRKVRFITSLHQSYEDNPIDGVFNFPEFYDSEGNKIILVSDWAYLDDGEEDLNNGMSIEEALNFDW